MTKPRISYVDPSMLANPEMGKEMGRRGKERVESEFRFNVFAKSLRKILRELCES